MAVDRFVSRRVAALGDYAFAEVDLEVAKLRARGIEPIDFGVGDPTAPTPEVVRRATAAALEARQTAGYPSYVGDQAFLDAVSAWIERRFGVSLDGATEVSSTLGAKEAVFNFHEAVVDPGDVVLCPSPGYPPYSRGTRFAEGEPYHLPLLAERRFLLDFAAIPDAVARRAKLLWLNYPNSPSGAVAPRSFYQEALEFAASYDLIIASDEAYSELYYEAPPLSILNVARERVLVFNSLSKRSAMTTYRIGWVAGDPDLVALFRKVKTNIDSGTPTFIQDGAVAALADETHVRAFRAEYRANVTFCATHWSPPVCPTVARPPPSTCGSGHRRACRRWSSRPPCCSPRSGSSPHPDRGSPIPPRTVPIRARSTCGSPWYPRSRPPSAPPS